MGCWPEIRFLFFYYVCFMNKNRANEAASQTSKVALLQILGRIHESYLRNPLSLLEFVFVVPLIPACLHGAKWQLAYSYYLCHLMMIFCHWIPRHFCILYIPDFCQRKAFVFCEPCSQRKHRDPHTFFRYCVIA